MARTTETRDERWNLRVAEAEDCLVREAAAHSETGLTTFVTKAAVAEARRVLADRRAFALPDDEWERFNALLDRPATVPAGLRRLLAEPSVFDD